MGDSEALFAEAQETGHRDHGRLWGISICGPMLLVDYADRGVLANLADPEGKLQRVLGHPVYQGVLPDDVIIARTATVWERCIGLRS